MRTFRNPIRALLMLGLGLAHAGAVDAGAPEVGTPVGGGVFLYRESVERYWNDWLAFPLMTSDALPTSGQARLTITGEGKTAAFIGNLSLNCATRKHFWESAGQGDQFLTQEAQAEALVPDRVVQNAIQLFCQQN